MPAITYRIHDSVSHEIRIKKSRFICTLIYAENVSAYRDALTDLALAHPEAGHLCSAAIIHDGQQEHHIRNDDGEPSGTAGKPMHNVLAQQNLRQTAAFVVRYYGGIKLGAGGLTRAYSNSVSEALKLAQLTPLIDRMNYHIDMPYKHVASVKHLLGRLNFNYTADTHADGMRCQLNLSDAEAETLMGQLNYPMELILSD